MNDLPPVRRARESDGPAIVSLWLALQKEHVRIDHRYRLSRDAELRYRNDITEFLRSDVWRFVVAVVSGQVVGFISARHWFPEPIYEQRLEIFVDSIYVEAAFRRQGIGRALVSEIRRWGEESEAVRLRLGALAQNADAVNFWVQVSGEPDIISLTIELESSGQ
jgi:GNAT superfamily N-acetyltransferase